MRVGRGKDGAGRGREAARDIQVWQVDLRQPAAWVDQAASLLSPDERELAARGTPDVRRRRLVARAALRIALSDHLACAPGSLRFVRGHHGKPALADVGGGGLQFSVSRSEDCCLIALTKIGPVGVDVERVVPRTWLDEIVANRFAPAEAAAILRLSGEQRLRAFYNCWTRKEAYLKARGVGLTIALERVEVSIDDERPAILALDDDDPAAWTVAALDPGPHLIGALVLRSGREWAVGAVETSSLPLRFDGFRPSHSRSEEQ